MMLLNLAALLVVGLSSVKGECRRNGVPCLEYTVLQTHEGYEERVYPSIVWVSASARANGKSDVSLPLFKTLYSYLRGDNDRGEHLQMVVPVRTKKFVNRETNTYVMSVALLPEQSDHVPVPLNPNVTVTREPRTIYIARSFGGQSDQEAVWDNHANILKYATLDDDSVDSSFYYMNAYDCTLHESERLNEVWMIKRRE